MDRIQVNILKTKLMDGYRFCMRVYEGGIESTDQFSSFENLCQNYVDMCNFWCDELKPLFGYIQYDRMKKYKDVHRVCEFTVGSLNVILQGFNAMLDKQAEEAEAIAAIEKRLRIEHKIALELKEEQNQIAKTRPIGYCINREKNDEIIYDN